MNSKVEVWDKIWKKQISASTADDPMSCFIAQCIYNRFQKLTSATPQNAIEVGAGPGRSSRYLSFLGIRTGILDYSSDAIQLAKLINSQNPTETKYYELSFFDVDELKVPEKYDLVWNAGVLEHFSPDQQREIIHKMNTMQSDNGLTMILTPYAGSFFYRFGKWLLEKLKRFPYGQEIPVHTLRPVLPSDVSLVVKEESVGFVILLFNAFRAMSHLPGFHKTGVWLHESTTGITAFLLNKRFSREVIFALDSMLSKFFGGYLLLTVCRRNS